jgi:hypothetical protein
LQASLVAAAAVNHYDLSRLRLQLLQLLQYGHDTARLIQDLQQQQAAGSSNTVKEMSCSW